MEEDKHHKNPWIIRKLEHYFYWHGKVVAQKPWLFASICVILCGLFSIGLITYKPETNPYKLWIPSDSDFVQNTNWLWSKYPPDTRYHSVIITADNVLRPEVLMHVLTWHEKIANTKSSVGHTWTDKCFKIPVVDIRGDDLSETEEESDDEDFLSFETEDDTSGLDYDIYDFTSLYDTNSDDNDKTVSSRKRRSSDPSIEFYPKKYCDIVKDVTQPTCLETSIAELWAKDGNFTNQKTKDKIANATKQEILDIINTKSFSEIFLFDKDFTALLGGITKNSSNHIIGAKATILRFYGQIDLDAITEEDKKSSGYGPPVDKGTLDFEGALADILLDFSEETNNNQDGNIKTYVSLARSFDDLANQAIGADIPRIIGGVSIVYAYVLMMLGGFDCVQQKPLLGFIGLFCVFLSVMSSYGICSLLGLLFSPMHNMIPFLLMGIGIDDMFVIVQSHINLEQNDPSWKKRPIDELVGETLKHAGVAITITSITDLLVFIVGASTVLPALRSFCLYCAFGVLIVYILQSVLFTAFLALDIKRVRENRNGFLFCITHKMEEGTEANTEEGAEANDETKELPWWRYNPGKVIFNKFAIKLMHPVAKTCVILITAFILGFGIYGLTQLDQKFNPAWFLPPGSYLLDWLDNNEKYFPGSGDRVTVNIGEIDYDHELWKVEALVNELKNQTDIITSVDSWLSDFRPYVEDNQLVKGTLDPYNIDASDLFYRLTQFLYSSSGAKYTKNFHFDSPLTCGTESPQIKLSTIDFSHKIFSGPSEHLPAMNRIKKIVASYNFSSKVFAVGHNYASWETDEIIQWETFQNVGISLVVVFIATALLMVHFQSCLMVFICVLMTLVDVAGFMHFWGMTINITTCITLVIAVGLCIDQAAHIAHTFLVTQEPDRNKRAIQTLTEIGPPVMSGGISTFLAFSIASTSESHVFLTFFKIFTLVVIFGLFHGLVFLPVMLSLLPQGTSGKIWDSSSQPKSIKKDVQHNLGFDTKTSTLSIATVGTSETPEQGSPRAPSDFQNIS